MSTQDQAGSSSPRSTDAEQGRVNTPDFDTTSDDLVQEAAAALTQAFEDLRDTIEEALLSFDDETEAWTRLNSLSWQMGDHYEPIFKELERSIKEIEVD
ncbi:hypothetical protein HKX48_005835 [Thoreauomyces humboldtii]|nr:hypothetical protein HKX48_005835 [Thoreauomyces humboldtii]